MLCRAYRLIAQEGATEPTAAGRLRLVNRGTGPVTVEVRLSTGEDCTEGSVLATRAIDAGRAWVISSSRPLCIRTQERSRTATGPTQGWERKQPPAGRTEEVEL
jgi:hypothetical protein